MNYSNIHHSLIGGYMPYLPWFCQPNLPASNPFGSVSQSAQFPFSYVPSYYAPAGSAPNQTPGSFRVPLPIYKNPVPLVQNELQKGGDPKISDPAKQICYFSKQRQIKSGDSLTNFQTTSVSPSSFLSEIIAEARSNANCERVLRSRQNKRTVKNQGEYTKISVTDQQNKSAFRVQINDGKELVVLDQDEVQESTRTEPRKKPTPKSSQAVISEAPSESQLRVHKTSKTSIEKAVDKKIKKLPIAPKIKRICHLTKHISREVKTHRKMNLKRERAQLKSFESEHSTGEEDKRCPYAEIPDLITDTLELTKRKQKILMSLQSRLVKSSFQPHADKEARILCCNESEASST